ncbi:unnamed protein product [Discula destructiva]
MASSLLLLLIGLLATTVTVTAQNSSSNAPCVTGDAVHMIIARASLEPPGPGVIGQVATQVMAQLPGSDTEAVAYPATLNNYPSSEAAGVSAMTALLTGYASRCPDSKIVMMGYSQGAQVAADVMCGTDEGPGFAATSAVKTTVQDRVAAVVLMGDPSKAQNQSFINGTSTKNGIFPRGNTNACNDIAKRMVSYCNAGDTFCDSGNNLTVHLSYVEDNGTAAMEFIVTQAKSNAGGSAGGSGQGNLTVSGSAAVAIARWGMALAAVMGVGLGFVW